MKLLGLDIGSNSVGSAGIDTDKQLIQMGVSVFPAGIEESDTKRGAPKNQSRRTKRSHNATLRSLRIQSRRHTSRRRKRQRKNPRTGGKRKVSCLRRFARLRHNSRVKVVLASPFLGLVALFFMWVAFLGLMELKHKKK